MAPQQQISQQQQVLGDLSCSFKKAQSMIIDWAFLMSDNDKIRKFYRLEEQKKRLTGNCQKDPRNCHYDSVKTTLCI